MKKAARKSKSRSKKLATVQAVPFSFANLELQIVRLTSSASKLNLRGGAFPGKTKLNVGSNIGLSPEENTIKINVSCQATTTYEDSDDEPAVLLQCEYQAVYIHAAGQSPSHESTTENGELATAVAMNTLWPYVRHFMFLTTSQMGLPPLTLPLFKSRFMPSGPQPIESPVTE
jgi:hypothetical protein